MKHFLHRGPLRRSRATRSTCLALWLLLAAGLAYGQEAEVPLDLDGRLFAITPELETRMNLFPQVRGFVEARLFESPDGAFVLQTLYREDGRLFLLREALSASGVDEFRQRVTEALTQRAPQALLDQDGRGELLRGTLALALGYYGWAVPVAVDVNDGQSAVALYMLVSSTGFFGPFIATKQVPVTKAQASLALYGATRGAFHGAMAAEFLGADESRTHVGASVAGGFIEALVGFTSAGRMQMTRGTADLIGTGGDLGGGIGLGVAYVAGLFDDNAEGDRRSGWGVGLAGSFVGMAAGYGLATTEPYTAGDTAIFRAASLIGAYAGLTTAVAAGSDEGDVEKGAVAATLLGTGVGMIAGQRLVRDRDFTTSQGTFVTLGALGGGLLGAGFGYLLAENDEVAILVPSAAGAAAGLALLHSSFARDARRAAERAGLELRFDPVALALSRSGRLAESVDLPVVSLAASF